MPDHSDDIDIEFVDSTSRRPSPGRLLTRSQLLGVFAITLLALLANCSPIAKHSHDHQDANPESATSLPPAEAPVEPAADDSPDRDFSNKKVGTQGRYRISIRSRTLPVPLRQIHEWIVHVESLDGEPAFLKKMQIAGGMPEHGHGFPTQPRVTKYLGQGDYLVEGVKFNMEGLWQMALRMAGPDGRDEVTFNLDIHDGPIKSSQGSVGEWNATQTQIIASLSLASLGRLPDDSSNRFYRDPRAAALGEKLFFEKGLSSNGEIACATCHDPKKSFADGMVLSQGLDQTARHAPSLLGTGFGSWYYWDGRRDSLWSQAITPIEAIGEMGSTRVEAVRYVVEHSEYGPRYAALFGRRPRMDKLPKRAGPFAEEAAIGRWNKLSRSSRDVINRAFANIGKAIAAFERTIVPTPAKFDRYVKALLEESEAAASKIMSADELAGLSLFIDNNRTQCLRCHNGPLFTNHGFHNIGTGLLGGPKLDFGRMVGAQAVQIDPFNCAGSYSDSKKDDCKDLRFLQKNPHDVADLRGAFKVPTLRNIAVSGPYLHDGRHDTLTQVVEHYRNPPDVNETRHELAETKLTAAEISQIVAFLKTLTGE